MTHQANRTYCDPLAIVVMNQLFVNTSLGEDGFRVAQ